MDRTQLYHGLSLVLGTLIAFVVGLVGPGLAGSLADRLPVELQRGGIVGLAALFVIGVVAGAFGRGGVGLLAVWVGLVLALARPLELQLVPAGFAGLAAVAISLAVATVGYAVARAVDPFWGSEPGTASGPKRAPTQGSESRAHGSQAAPPSGPKPAAASSPSASPEDNDPFRPR